MSEVAKVSGPAPAAVTLMIGVAVTIGGTALLAQGSDTLRDDWFVLAAAGGVAALLAALLVAATGPRDSVAAGAVAAALPAAAEPVRVVAPVAAGTEVLVPLTTLASCSLPKEGASAEENDDAGAAGALGVAAVADGASSSYDAGAWARILVRRWLDAPPAVTPSSVAAWALECAAAYGTERAERVGAEGGGSWWQAEAGQKAAHATFLGLRVVRTTEGLVWRAVAVGDALVVHLRRDGSGLQVVSGFPYESSSAASGAPLLLASDAAESRALPSLRTLEGPAEPDDVWLLATDEVARWALAAEESGEPIWEVLAAGGKAFERAVSDARAARRVVNDDMTCVVVRASA